MRPDVMLLRGDRIKWTVGMLSPSSVSTRVTNCQWVELSDEPRE